MKLGPGSMNHSTGQDTAVLDTPRGQRMVFDSSLYEVKKPCFSPTVNGTSSTACSKEPSDKAKFIAVHTADLDSGTKYLSFIL